MFGALSSFPYPSLCSLRHCIHAGFPLYNRYKPTMLANKFRLVSKLGTFVSILRYSKLNAHFYKYCNELTKETMEMQKSFREQQRIITEQQSSGLRVHIILHFFLNICFPVYCLLFHNKKQSGTPNFERHSFKIYFSFFNLK